MSVLDYAPNKIKDLCYVSSFLLCTEELKYYPECFDNLAE
jgi:hypothetical protein